MRYKTSSAKWCQFCSKHSELNKLQYYIADTRVKFVKPNPISSSFIRDYFVHVALCYEDIDISATATIPGVVSINASA